MGTGLYDKALREPLPSHFAHVQLLGYGQTGALAQSSPRPSLLLARDAVNLREHEPIHKCNFCREKTTAVMPSCLTSWEAVAILTFAVFNTENSSMASELVVKAESLTKSYPDQSALLALSAWKISRIAEVQAMIQAALRIILLKASCSNGRKLGSPDSIIPMGRR